MEQEMRKMQPEKHQNPLQRAKSSIGKSDGCSQTDADEEQRPRRYSIGGISDSPHYSRFLASPTEVLKNSQLIRMASGNGMSPVELSKLSGLTPPPSPVSSRGKHHVTERK